MNIKTVLCRFFTHTYTIAFFEKGKFCWINKGWVRNDKKLSNGNDVNTAEWDGLDYHHKAFIMRVYNSNGSKYGAEPCSINSDKRYDPPNDDLFYSISLWEKAEESGFIKNTGSYSWVTTDKFNKLLNLKMGIKAL